jgi:acetoin utilization deacetylase AcuC-like enzyme
MAPLDDLDLAHESRYVTELGDALQRIAADGRPRALDADTIAAAGTWAAVMRAAGAAVAATDAVIDGTFENAFCAVRPPGHHATRARRWASASSTTSPSPPATRSTCAA